MFCLFSLVAQSATYYADAASGNDDNSGKNRASAWKTLARINKTVFRPGDRILFKSGGIWVGQLWPKGSGSMGKPITVDKYGAGVDPIVNGGGVEDAVKLYNQEYWVIRNLEITNMGEKSAARRGVHLILDNYGTAHEVTIADLTIHDVNGDLARKDNGGIIWSVNGDSKPSRFDGLTIERCVVYRVDRSGIAAQSFHWSRDKWFPSLHVTIRRNSLDDIGGDGIVPWACDGVLVQWNTAGNCNRRSHEYNAAIWPWSCDNSVFEHNEAYLTHGTRDGQGFDSDWNSRNTLFQYNYSHDNEGGFILICNDGSMPSSTSSGNTGTIVRYNVSQNDGTRTFHLPGPVEDTKIYNNTIYIGPGMDVNVVQMSNWHGWAKNTVFYNNIFYVDGTAHYGHELTRSEDGRFQIGPGMAPAQETVFDSNVFFGRHVDPPADAAGLNADPQFVKAGSGERGLQTLTGYQLRPGSPAIGSGRRVVAEQIRDLEGVPVAGKPDRGAFQYRSPSGKAQARHLENDELKRAMRRNRALVAEYFRTTYGAEYTAVFWRSTWGGECPGDVLMLRARAEVQILADRLAEGKTRGLPRHVRPGMTDPEFIRAMNLTVRDLARSIQPSSGF
jgi:hypothetical protein